MVPSRVVTTWLVLFGLLVAAFTGTVIILNSTLYSAGGFVGSYLAALARHDVGAALELAGPGSAAGSDTAADDLLDPRALGELDDIRQVSDIDQGGGVHEVSYSYTFGSGDAHRTTFTVKYDGTRFGLFSNWRFSSSPLGVLSVTPKHEASFTVNGLQVASTGPSIAKVFLALSPGRYLLGHSSSYFTAESVPVRLVDAGGSTAAAVDIRANSAFTKQVQKQLDSYLKQCATQQVLLPTDCPFGKQIADQLDGLPAWSMTSYPVVRIVPGNVPGTWSVPEAPAAAHLTVRVRSLFDGSLSTVNEDIPFSVGYLITFKPDGGLVITGE
jgi:hypothetical protein